MMRSRPRSPAPKPPSTRATGQRPAGFRGPGSASRADGSDDAEAARLPLRRSTFPTFLGPLARAYYFFTAAPDARNAEQRKELFGGIAEGFRPLRPYRWRLGERPLLEVPVTTMPVFRLPFHVSYLIYLAGFSPGWRGSTFASRLTLCRLTGIQPSLLLHPLDFLGADDGLEPLNSSPAWTCRANQARLARRLPRRPTRGVSRSCRWARTSTRSNAAADAADTVSPGVAGDAHRRRAPS